MWYTGSDRMRSHSQNMCVRVSEKRENENENEWVFMVRLRTQILFACSTILWQYAYLCLSLSLVLCVRMLIIPPDILAWCAALISVGEECTLYTRSNNFQAHIRQIVSHWKSQISFQALCHFSTVFHSFCLVNDVTLHGAHNFHSFLAQQCMTYNFN